jgi:hypothetical protein
MKPVAVVLFFGCILIVDSPSASAADRKTGAQNLDPAARTVDNILRAEAAGVVDRRTQLAETLKQYPEAASARWQAGFVKDGGSWLAFDEPARDHALARVLAEYRQRRDEAPQTFRGQLNLANWCLARTLPDQERVHLTAALARSDGDAAEAIARRLGYQQIAGRWLSREQLLEWNELHRRATQSLTKWEPQLNRLVARLAGTRPQRELAIAGLKKLADNSAVPAIEYVLAGKDEDTALVAVDVLRALVGLESSVALARQAVFSPWAAVREAAGRALQGRPLDHFVPALVGLLSTPIRSELQVSQSWFSPGVLYYNLILSQETENQFQVGVLTTTGLALRTRVDVVYSRDLKQTLSASATTDLSTTPRGLTDLDRSIRDGLRPREDAVSRQNEIVNELNGRVQRLLELVSGEAPKTEPQEWWQWWASYSDLESTGPKQVTVVEENDEVSIPLVDVYISYCSCFAAGTPVWTESGAQAIETIQVGDRVLAKDIESGELSYKPVLQTTIRPPKELTTLRFGDETIVCTGGHRFWSSGSGWIKARDLAPQALLHAVTGNTPVWSAKKGNTAETYNLVVADFHTYFVGKTGVLCQDLLIPRATNSVVPGLARK